MTNNPILRKAFATQGELKENTLRAVISTTGNLDCYGDVLFPGAFDSVLADFISQGFVAIGHDWDGLPVGYVLTAAMDGNKLVAHSEFHTHQEAQDARTVCIERLAAKKTISTSIGFMPDYQDGVKYFSSGADLLIYAKGAGYDLSMFDAEVAIRDRYCRAILSLKRLYEFSIVVVPANPKANEAEARSAETEVSPLVVVDRGAQMRAIDLSLLTIAG